MNFDICLALAVASSWFSHSEERPWLQRDDRTPYILSEPGRHFDGFICTFE